MVTNKVTKMLGQGKSNHPRPKFSKALFNTQYVEEFVKAIVMATTTGWFRKEWVGRIKGTTLSDE